MTAHKHAKLLKQYVAIAGFHDKPWEAFQRKREDGVWVEKKEDAGFAELCEYRLNPEFYKRVQWGIPGIDGFIDCEDKEKFHDNSTFYRMKPAVKEKPVVDLASEAAFNRFFPYVETNNSHLEKFVRDIRFDTWFKCCQAHKDAGFKQ